MMRKQKNEKKKNKIKIIRFTLIGSVLSIGIGLFGYRYIVNSYSENNNVEAGVLKIKELEAVNINDIRDKIDGIKKKKEEAENQRKLKEESLENQKNNQDFNKIFETSVIMGDSRCEGLTVYEVLSSSSVVAHKGRNVVSAKEDIQKLVDLKPKNIFMSYGINDLELFNNCNEFIEKYKELIGYVQAKLPNAKIFVTSIVPVQQKAINTIPKYNNVANFNEAINGMCNELNINFIDISNSINLESDLYEGDGIHFKPDYYKGYLNILKERANL